MRNITTFFIGCFTLLFSAKISAQSISPDANNGVYCPLQTITFGVTLPVGIGATNLSVTGAGTTITGSNGFTLVTVPANVTSQPTGITYPGGTTTVFSFTGFFSDDNTPQTFKVSYFFNGVTNDYYFTYYKIESFLYNVFNISRPGTPPTIAVTKCQTAGFNFSFPDVFFASNNPITNTSPAGAVKYGNIIQYRYQIPVGWSLNGTASTGTNWITASSNVTITPDLTHGEGSNILIQALNPCNPALTGPQAQVAITRPPPVFTITASDNHNYICSGSKTFTLNNLPAGGTVAWSITNTSAATIPAGSAGTTVNVTKAGYGISSLKATVTLCSVVYPPVSINVSVGAPQFVSEAVSTLTNITFCPDNNIYLILPSQGFYSHSGTAKVTDGAGLATSFVWSASNNIHMIWVDNFDGSVTVSSKFTDGLVTMSCTMSNACGSTVKAFTFVSSNCNAVSRSFGPTTSLVSTQESDEDSAGSIQNVNKIIRVYPNPATSTLIISGMESSSDRERSLSSSQYLVNVYDATGALKLSQKNKGNTTMEMDIKKLPAGIYIVEVLSNRNKKSYKIVKQ